MRNKEVKELRRYYRKNAESWFQAMYKNYSNFSLLTRVKICVNILLLKPVFKKLIKK
jgi:hypothetical protein